VCVNVILYRVDENDLNFTYKNYCPSFWNSHLFIYLLSLLNYVDIEKIVLNSRTIILVFIGSFFSEDRVLHSRFTDDYYLVFYFDNHDIDRKMKQQPISCVRTTTLSLSSLNRDSLNIPCVCIGKLRLRSTTGTKVRQIPH
jgi:hypothetical protein